MADYAYPAQKITVFTLIARVIAVGNPYKLAREIWSHRYLIEQMIRRELSKRYKGSVLGLLWSIINPLIMLAIYTFVFSVIFKASWRPSVENVPLGEFAITLFAGLIPYYLFSEAVNRGPTLITDAANYVKKVVFPLEILPVVAVGTAAVNSLINLSILLAASLLLLGGLPATIIFIPLIYIPLILLTLGLTWFLSSLGVYVRDTGQFTLIVTQVLFFLSPIFYPASSVPEYLQIVLKLNPLSMIVENFRGLLLWGEFFSLKLWFIWTLIATLIAVMGYVWFRATKKGFADVI